MGATVTDGSGCFVKNMEAKGPIPAAVIAPTHPKIATKIVATAPITATVTSLLLFVSGCLEVD
jgi:hypothetical protein